MRLEHREVEIRGKAKPLTRRARRKSAGRVSIILIR
jgi:hypothetical protein